MSKGKMEDLLSSLSEEDKIQLMENLKKELASDTADPTETKPAVGEDFIVRNRNLNLTRRRSKVKAGKNQWTDTGEFRDVNTPLPEDFEKTPRRKASPKKKEVECHMCGKTFKQDSRYSYGEFPRCNRCTGR